MISTCRPRSVCSSQRRDGEGYSTTGGQHGSRPKTPLAVIWSTLVILFCLHSQITGGCGAAFLLRVPSPSTGRATFRTHSPRVITTTLERRKTTATFQPPGRPQTLVFSSSSSENNNNEWTSDFDGFVVGDDDRLIMSSPPSSNADNNNNNSPKKDPIQPPKKPKDSRQEKVKEEDDAGIVSFAQLFEQRQRVAPPDLTACQTRRFALGPDLMLTDFVGNMGFDEVTDWEYYYPEDDVDDDRKRGTTPGRQVVRPNPFDPSQPRRTRTSSGSVVRIFRGEWVGLLGNTLSAQGMDRRVLVKEFTGTLALQLARAELESVGKLQSDLMTKAKEEAAQKGEWVRAASARSVMARQDTAYVTKLLKLLSQQASFLGILGEVNLAELEDSLDPNAFYRALKVPAPKPDAIWVAYEYAGLSTLQSYCEPALLRRSKWPQQRGFFGNPIPPPPLPSWRARANYVVQGMMKGAIEALATIHEAGLVHRSIGRTSFIVSSTTTDKREAISPFATSTGQLVIKLADFGFSGPYQESTNDEEFRARARTFGLTFRPGENTVATANFAIAEDMHALGFVFLVLLLTSLAELPTIDHPMPATDEDTMQRLLGEIFDKDIQQFREYAEAEDVWDNLVGLLDENDGAGWTVLETLLMAREKAAKNRETDQIFTLRGLLSNKFFATDKR